MFPRGLGLGDTAQGPEVAHPALHLPRCVWWEPIERDAEKKRGPIRGEATDSESAAGELTADEVMAARSFPPESQLEKAMQRHFRHKKNPHKEKPSANHQQPTQ